MQDTSLKISKNKIIIILFTLYLICFTSYNLNKGFDDYIIKIVPILLILTTLSFNYKKIRINKLFVWFFAFWLFYILSINWALNKEYVIKLIPNILYLFPGIFCLPYIIMNKDGLNTILKCIIFSLVYSLIIILIRDGISQIGNARIGTSLGLSSNIVGMRLAIGSFICLYFINIKDKHKKLYMFLLIIFSFFCLFTGSRKAVLMLVIGLSSYEILVSKGISFFLRCVFAVLILITFVHFIFNNTYLYNVLGKRFESMISQIENTGQTDASVIERNFYIKEAMELFKNKPILGVGGNNFAAYMELINYKHVAYSHNNFTELLSTLGIIGFILYYSAWLSVFIKLVKEFLINKNNLNLLLVITIGIWIIMDYGNVSYYEVFHILMLSISFLYLRISNNRVEEVT